MSPQCVAQVLRHLPQFDDPRLLVGPSSLDDAGVILYDESTALVQTVDLFSPNVDDPHVFGRIVAANCLSDAYAMGARPLTVLNIVCWPQPLDVAILGRMLQGGAEVIRESGAVLMGGHSMFDSEVKYGLAVTALAHPGRLMTNAAAKPGDVLILTKPLGTGLIGAAIKNGVAPADVIERGIAVMTRLNRHAAETFQNARVAACTDVTGFGLLGHAAEMAGSSKVTLRISASAVPLIDGTLELAEQDQFPAGSATNHEYAQGWTRVADGIPELTVRILTDAQTSGGLLAAVPAEEAPGILQTLHQGGDTTAAVIGEAIPRESGIHIRVAV